MRVFNLFKRAAHAIYDEFRKVPYVNSKIPKGRIGRVQWHVKIEGHGLGLSWHKKWQAELFQNLIGQSITSHHATTLSRIEIDPDTGLHVTYPQEEKHNG